MDKLLRDAEFFKNMGEEALEEICVLGRYRTYPKDHTLFLEGERRCMIRGMTRGMTRDRTRGEP